ncbi:hypothetical protein GCM10027452_00860 [Micromonospora halotolerans]
MCVCQLVIQVCSPSTENACSQWALFSVISDQMKRARILRPSYSPFLLRDEVEDFHRGLLGRAVTDGFLAHAGLTLEPDST